MGESRQSVVPASSHSRTTENAIIYNRIWDMLVRRSPNLRSLAIEGEWDEPIYAARLLDGNWPKLQKLSLTPVWFQEHIHEGSQPLVEFLERHPAVEQLSLKHVRLDLSQLSPEALPKLRVFNGRLDHLRELGIRGQPLNALGLQNPSTQLSSSPLSQTLEELVLPDAMALRELTPLAISSMLVGLRSLTALTISFSLESGYDSNGVFRTIASACPQLHHLDLSCTSKPSFHLVSTQSWIEGQVDLLVRASPSSRRRSREHFATSASCARSRLRSSRCRATRACRRARCASR